MDELRIVARYAVESAQQVLPLFEQADGHDPRPRVAIEAAWEFVQWRPTDEIAAHHFDGRPPSRERSAWRSGAARCPRGRRRRLRCLLASHCERHAGRPDLRAAASAARAAELSAGDDPEVGDALIEQARRRATPALIAVLQRYPFAPVGKGRVAQLMNSLDTSLRTVR